ncbi:MAG: hypothetical protein JW744_04575 [Candidatus Diapherotrites archaeon]|uniref:Uncharacterized protein n=1 Tax=Candidatus Iainarchaeum sp. TaxID=3101447 RepID=A0A938YUE8_9ARCH|nr:hypothetical protein [Candidatus Diapherotrites archaeon]
MPEKEKPKRKLPKKSKRPKRRYVLFQLRQGSCNTAKQGFDLVMGQFSMEQRKALGVWFIEFSPSNSKGIVRCNLGGEKQLANGINSIPKEFGAKTLKTSGTLKALKGK